MKARTIPKIHSLDESLVMRAATFVPGAIVFIAATGRVFLAGGAAGAGIGALAGGGDDTAGSILRRFLFESANSAAKSQPIIK
jgi:hypothetical protein